tara:strand:+ start:179 stop:958 length:780 start_codon:yes stop_codon:yes gene_type:complete
MEISGVKSMAKGVNWQMILKVRTPRAYTNEEWKMIKYQISAFMMDFESKNPDLDAQDEATLLVGLMELGTQQPASRHHFILSMRVLMKQGVFQQNRPPWDLRQGLSNAKLTYEDAARNNPNSRYDLFMSKNEFGKPTQSMVIPPAVDRNGLVEKYPKARKMENQWIQRVTAGRFDTECCRQAKLSWLRSRRPRLAPRPTPNKHPLMDVDCADFMIEIIETIKNKSTSKGDRDVLGDWWYCEDLKPNQQNPNDSYWKVIT